MASASIASTLDRHVAQQSVVLPGTLVDLLLLGLFEVFVKLRGRAKVMSLTIHICSSYIQLPGTFLAF